MSMSRRASRRNKHPRGLVVAGKRVLPMRDAENPGVLVADKDGVDRHRRRRRRSAREARHRRDRASAVLTRGAVTRSRATCRSRDKRSPRHAALGITHDGRASSSRAARSRRGDGSRASGCKQRCCSMRRARGLLDRGEDATPLAMRYDAPCTTPSPTHAARDSRSRHVFVLGATMKPRSFRFTSLIIEPDVSRLASRSISRRRATARAWSCDTRGSLTPRSVAMARSCTPSK